MNGQCGLNQERMLYKLYMRDKAVKVAGNIFMCERSRSCWSLYGNQLGQEMSLGMQEPRWFGQSQIGLKPWLRKPCFKPSRRIRRVLPKEFQLSSSSHISLWFVTLTTSAKAYEAAELYLTLRKLLNLTNIYLAFITVPVGWGCRKHRLHLCRGVGLSQASILQSSRLGLKNTPTASLQRGKTLLNEYLMA